MVEVYATDDCVWCARALRLLRSRGAQVQVHYVGDDRFELLERTGRLTVPQILIDDHLIGGFQDLAAADRSGQLQRLLDGD
jgi:glutaredoxin 3